MISPVAFPRLLQLAARRQEDDRERTPVEMTGGIVGLPEALLPIDLQKRLAILIRGPQLPPLHDDDRERGQGEDEQNEQDELDDQTGLKNQVDQVETHGETPLIAVSCAEWPWM